METYIGTKIIKAEEMTQKTFLKNYKKEDPALLKQMIDEDGYHVHYEDGYDSWSPKDVFEKSYRKITGNEKRMFTPFKRKIGHFSISKLVMLKFKPNDLIDMFQKLLFMPTRISDNGMNFKYEGYSEKFDELYEEENIPEYLLIMENTGNTIILNSVERMERIKELEI